MYFIIQAHPDRGTLQVEHHPDQSLAKSLWLVILIINPTIGPVNLSQESVVLGAVQTKKTVPDPRQTNCLSDWMRQVDKADE